MLVGLAAKNAILIVEFAKAELDEGRSLVDAALDGRAAPPAAHPHDLVRVHPRLRAAVDRQGAGAAARRMLGTVVVAGMLAATLLGIFFIPALFVLVERIGGAEKKHAERGALLPVPEETPS